MVLGGPYRVTPGVIDGFLIDRRICFFRSEGFGGAISSAQPFAETFGGVCNKRGVSRGVYRSATDRITPGVIGGSGRRGPGNSGSY